MKQLSFIVGCLLLGAAACKKVNGDGPVVSETRTVPAFAQVHFSVKGTLYYEKAEQPSVELRAQRNILHVIETNLHNGSELEVRLRDNTVIYSYEPVEIIVRGPQINGFHLSGSGNIKALQPIETSRLWLESEGSGDIHIGAVTAGELATRIKGSGRINVINGEVAKANHHIEGSGKIEATGVRAKEVYTRTSGSGDMRVWAEDYLETKISGSGDVYYKGTPQVKINISGSGKISPID
ncbi:MAG: head GIN domain-containing protein [Flavihumibacter sp.]